MPVSTAPAYRPRRFGFGASPAKRTELGRRKDQNAGADGVVDLFRAGPGVAPVVGREERDSRLVGRCPGSDGEGGRKWA